MRFTEALYYSLATKKRYPHYTLCGSVALILAGKIPVRDVGDIDFVTNERFVNISELLIETGSEHYSDVIENDGYRCVNIKNRCGVNGVWSYSLFIFPDNVIINKTNQTIKLELQSVDDILKYKKQYNRHKDRQDIKELQ